MLSRIIDLVPGIVAAIIVTICAYIMAFYLPVSTMVLALILGFLLQPLCYRIASLEKGLQLSATKILKLGIICLGARIHLGLIVDLGWQTLLIIVTSMLLTTLFGVYLGKKVGLTKVFTALIVGSVCVCGSAAALAVSSIMPKDKHRDRDLSFVIVAVTVLSTLGLVLYPFMVLRLNMSPEDMGIVMGASLHNVAQSVAAGFNISGEVGDVATVVKLTRVSFLAPYLLLIALLFKDKTEGSGAEVKPSLFPFFLIGFFILAGLNSIGLIPMTMVVIFSDLSNFCLIVAIAAIAILTPFKEFLTVPKPAIALMVALTLTLLVIVLCMIYLV